MPSKAEFYRQMAEQVSTQLVGSWKEWTAFLTTAARLYKYPFHEQMMIYAQRPDATACAEYDLWNEKMGRYVRRGSKGIALVDDSGDKPRLRYVFDISDTGTREHSRTPWLWQLEEQHIGPVSAMLERNYGVAGDNLAQQLIDVAGKLASEYWDEHQQDFRYIVDGSFLEEYDDLNIEVQFKSAATVSIAYALMSRCGLDTDQYFQHEDFMPIFDFNTPATVGALGAAVSQINQQVLRQIGVTVQHYEREQLAERSVTHMLFEMLILENFQAGLAWECILNKREAFRRAFDGFDLRKVASYSEEKMAALQADSGIIRNRLKIRAAVVNAQVFEKIQQEWGSFDQYLWHWTDEKIIQEVDKVSSSLSDAISKDLKKRGMKFVGTIIIYAYLQAVGVINSHESGCFLNPLQQ